MFVRHVRVVFLKRGACDCSVEPFLEPSFMVSISGSARALGLAFSLNSGRSCYPLRLMVLSLSYRGSRYCVEGISPSCPPHLVVVDSVQYRRSSVFTSRTVFARDDRSRPLGTEIARKRSLHPCRKVGGSVLQVSVKRSVHEIRRGPRSVIANGVSLLIGRWNF